VTAWHAATACIVTHWTINHRINRNSFFIDEISFLARHIGAQVPNF
jgi:hypothetical protein